jgi:hypothetical protein
MTVWTDFVKKYAADKGISYKAALSQASGPYKSRGEKPETKKPSEGTVQVKRNVAQRGLADIANKAVAKAEEKNRYVKINQGKAKLDLEHIATKAQRKAYAKRVGLPENLIQGYVDADYIYSIYENYEFRRTPKKVKNAVDRFNSVLQEIFREVSPGQEYAPREFFEPDQEFGNSDLGIEEDGDSGYYTWDSDATDYINEYTRQSKNLLKRIIDYKSGKNYGE